MSDLWKRIEELSPEKRRLLETFLEQEGVEARPETDQTPPSTPAEELLVRLWSEALGLERLGVRSNVFELGGDSIHAIQVVARARQAGVGLTSQQIFEHPTIAAMAAVAAVARLDAPGVSAPAGAAAGPGPVPLAPMQRWLESLELTQPDHWNQALLLEVAPEVTSERLEAAVGRLVDHHDALRSRLEGFGRGDRSAAARILPPGEGRPGLVRIDLARLGPEAGRRALDEHLARLQGSLDLERGPVLAVAWVDLGERGRRLLWSAHHAVVDGVSFRILLEDLVRLLAGEEELAPVPCSWAGWLRALDGALGDPAAAGRLIATAAPWLADPVEEAVASLPVDDPAGSDLERTAREVTVELDSDTTTAVVQELPTALRASVEETLLAALLAALARLVTDRGIGRRLVLDIESHGREELIPGLDLSRTVGWFTALAPVPFELPREAGRSGVLAALREAKERLRALPARGAAFSPLRWSRRPEARRLAEVARGEVMFNYLGHFDGALPPGSPLALAPEPPGPLFGGDNRRPHLLQVVAGVTGGRLRTTLVHGDRHRPETVARLAEDLRWALAELVAAARQGEATALAPSDFPEADLGAPELAALVARRTGSAQ